MLQLYECCYYRLDLGEYVVNDKEKHSAQYKLYAVINHSGTLYSGHCECNDTVKFAIV